MKTTVLLMHAPQRMECAIKSKTNLQRQAVFLNQFQTVFDPALLAPMHLVNRRLVGAFDDQFVNAPCFHCSTQLAVLHWFNGKCSPRGWLPASRHRLDPDRSL